LKTIAFKSCILGVLALGGVPAALAIEPIPTTNGWSGFIGAGGGYIDLKSNLVAGNDMIELGRPTISSISQGPQSDDTAFPFFTGEVKYTFGDRWQAFFGASIEDAVTLDNVTQLGLRKDLDSIGILQGGILFSGLPSQVWEDPYAEGVRREETDRNSAGGRLQWDRVLGTPVELTFSYRDISIDRERSGQGTTSVTCLADCQELMEREGDQYHFDASYRFNLGQGGRHILRPMVRYTIEDREGDAVSGDAYRLQLSYAFMGQGYTFVSNAAYGQTSFDEQNPLFNQAADADRVVLDTSLFYRLPTESKRWQAVARVFWGEEDSDVRFHDSEVSSASLGVIYRFGALPSAR
jgi:hypothetical protein